MRDGARQRPIVRRIEALHAAHALAVVVRRLREGNLGSRDAVLLQYHDVVSTEHLREVLIDAYLRGEPYRFIVMRTRAVPDIVYNGAVERMHVDGLRDRA